LVYTSRINIPEGVHPQSSDCAISHRVIVESTNALFGALVDASGRAEFYGTTD